MVVLETYQHYLIVKERKCIGIFDPALQMVVKFFKNVREAEEEVNAMEMEE